MKSQSNTPQPMRADGRSKILMGLTVFFALGTGIMGTLLWVQNRPTTTPVTVIAAPSSSVSESAATLPNSLPASGAPVVTAQDPPTSLTTGMSATQAAVTLGNWHYDQHQWTRAITNYREAITAGADNPNVRTDLGNALRFAGQPQAALEQYRIAQRQDPSHEQSLYNQGGLYAFSLKDTKQATVAWKAYLKRFPNGESAADARKFIAEHK